MTTKKIEGTIEAWESGKLGEDPKYAKKAEVNNKAIDESMDLQMISIRLQKTLIEDLKKIAKLNGIGYQPLMKQILRRFVDCEKKRIFNEFVASKGKETELLASEQKEPEAKRA